MKIILSSIMRTAIYIINRLTTPFGYQISIKKYNINNDNKTANEIFKNRKLEWDPSGFWCLSPMPTQEELDEYYASKYWDFRGKNEGVTVRDITHWIMLNDLIPDFLREKRTILNFGAGHGGISHLFWAAGHTVINIEPSDIEINYDGRWSVYKDVNDVASKSVDLVYGSHSLEHVQSIDTFRKELERVSKKESYFFWEVPNAMCHSNGAQKGTVDAPHTYYFTTKFFNKFCKEVILNDTYFAYTKSNVRNWKSSALSEEYSQVIRFLGKNI